MVFLFIGKISNWIQISRMNVSKRTIFPSVIAGLQTPLASPQRVCIRPSVQASCFFMQEGRPIQFTAALHALLKKSWCLLHCTVLVSCLWGLVAYMLKWKDNSNKLSPENFTEWNKLETWKLHSINSHLQLHFSCHSSKTRYNNKNLLFTKIKISWNGGLPPQSSSSNF